MNGGANPSLHKICSMLIKHIINRQKYIKCKEEVCQ